ncbi:MAG: tetratricopeptide repeat protein [Coleofasciculus sp. A1-SPW-01]|uniref:CHAT domain-containing protein n=1 Tax=Coleofasciculus sp. A1-SPW-01 TaxID=3070819 RepID=UPI0032FE50F2
MDEQEIAAYVAVNWLLLLAAKLAEMLGSYSTSVTPEDYLEFLRSVLQSVATDPRPQSLYPLLQNNLNKLDGKFAHILTAWANKTLTEVEIETAKFIAATIGNFSILIQEFPLGNIASNKEIAMAGYQAVATVFTQSNFPQDWAMTQNNLGNAYLYRIHGDRAENLEVAIAHYYKVLLVYTQSDFPQQWAGTQNNLAIAYSDRIRGDKAENLEVALIHYNNALLVLTQSDFPQDWAMTQNNLATAYLHRIRGNRAENLEAALSHYYKVLLVYTQSDFPQQWAATQNNLANAYSDRIRGDRAENLEVALIHYHQALLVRTQSDFPQDWATTQNNLAIAYRNRIRGDRAENLEKAITHYHNALLVRTQSDFPQDWAMTQNNLAIAYSDRIRGNRAENLEVAIAHYHQALLVLTQSDFPQDWAMTQNNLAAAYSDRIRGDRVENLEAAIAHYHQALLVYTQSDFPQDWAMTQNNLACVYYRRIGGDRAENLEVAIAHCNNALLVRTQSDFPQQWATTQNNLAAAYSNRIRGDRAENLEAAIVHDHNALLVCTPENYPIDCLQTSRSLANLAWDNHDFNLAIQSYELAIKAVEQSRNWVIDEERRQEILRESIYVYERIIQAYLNIGEIGKALEYTERFRCQRLVELMASDVLNPGGEITPEVQELLIDYEELHQRINSLRFSSQTEATPVLTGSRRLPDGDELAAHQAEIQKLEEQKQQVWKQLRRYDPVLAGQIQVEHLNLDQMQELIPNDTTALLSFYTTVEDTHIFILLKDQSPQVYTCKGQGLETFQKWIGENWFIPYIGANSEWRENMVSFLQELAQRLQLKDLISQYLTGIEELIIVPYLWLHQMPFAALPIDGIETFYRKEENSKPLSLQERGLERGFLNPVKSKGNGETRGLVTGKKSQPKVTVTPTAYLGDLFRIRIVPSCQILYYCQQRPPIPNQPTMGIVEDATEDLLFSRYECETLAQSYGVSADKRLQGRKATVTEYKTLASQVQVLHSSHHATSNPAQPLNSYLVLGDGSLTLSQLISPGWRMPNLSDVFACCCEVNFSLNKVTDDLLSLATGFLCAGARSVVSTQWSVEDLASALLAIFYYNFRQAGMSRSQALQQGQIKLRNLTGEDFARNYKGEMGKSLQQQYDQAMTRRNHANVKGDVDECQKWQKLADKIQVQQQRLQLLAKEKQPFSHPYYWAGFVSQGLA